MFVDFGIVNDDDTEPADGKDENDLRYIGQVGYEF